MIPWYEMARGPAEARRSLLLDYISPMLAITFWKALKNQHLVVLATISVSALLKIVTIVSTGLFALQEYQNLDVAVQVTATQKFDGRNLGLADPRPSYTLYGVERLNLPLPFGTTQHHAFQPFDATEVADRLELSAVVDVFSLGLECDRGQLVAVWEDPYAIVRRTSESAGLDPTLAVNISTSSCNIINARIDDAVPPASADIALTSYYGKMLEADCANKEESADPARLVIVFANRTYLPAPPNFSRGDPLPTITRSASLICRPTYNITAGLVRLAKPNSGSDQTPTISLLPNQRSRTISGINAWNIANACLSQLDALVSDLFRVPNSDGAWLDPFLGCAVSTMPEMKPADFMDPVVLEDASNRFLSSLSAQLAWEYLMIPTKEVFKGTESRIEHRLFAKALPIRISQGILGAMVALTLLLAVRIPRNAGIYVPGSVATIAAILSKSAAVVGVLESGCGTLAEKDLITGLAPYKFATATQEQPRFPTSGIFMTPGSSRPAPETADSVPNSPQPIKWYRPWAFKPLFMIVTLASPLLLIVALEILYQKASANRGIADIPSNRLIRYTWLYIPTITLAQVGMLFSMLDFEIESMQPFYELLKSRTLAKRSILSYPLGNMTLQSLWNAFRYRQIAVAATATATLFAPTLTIVASGLYSESNVTQTRDTSVHVLDKWNSSLYDSWDRDGYAASGVLASELVSNNLSFPQWTYDELAIPKLKIESNELGPYAIADVSDQDYASLSIRLPSVRGGMNCSLIPSTAYQGSSAKRGAGSCYPSCYNFDYQVPDWCLSNLDQLNLSLIMSEAYDYFGGLETIGGARRCYLIYAGFGSRNASKVDHFTPLLCTTSLEQVEADVVLSLPDYSIDTRFPPKADETTARLLSDSHVPMRPPDYWQTLNYSTPQFNGFFQAILFGKDPVAVDTLLDPANLIRASTHTYRILMAQILNANFRIPRTSAADPISGVIDGTITDPNRARLQQSAISTRILEGLLAILFVCAAIAYLAMDTRRILPCNPHSIAAIGSLLAGSRFIQEGFIQDEHDALLLSDKKMRRKDVFQGYVFSLGWWMADGRLERRGAKYCACSDEGKKRKRYGIDFELRDPPDREP